MRNSKANFRNYENWKPKRAWEMYHIHSVGSLRGCVSSNLKYVFLFISTPEHGSRQQRRLPSKLRLSHSCSWDVLPKVSAGRQYQKISCLIQRESLLLSVHHQYNEVFGNDKCCFFQHYFDGQKIILGCKHSLLVE